ncbi:hypothetical protein QBC38DRAFT_76001 [Podospora fimiseda]|uniref:Uncharacterized protein n=1 Tax=Podospora fimiseda TaxID=252190 RepID=A0AAN7BUU3_9PEZI|nr:hypothetical protein QBC38DRAFT_76001 [Podospora fimiseda]
MCHGHPHHHPCGHQSVNWHYCPSALIDLETGYETPCSNITFAGSQPSNSSCLLANCDYGGSAWTCCNCGGRNTSGWCTNISPNPRFEKNAITNDFEYVETCDHGCCRNCTKDATQGSNHQEDSGPRDGRRRESRKHRHRTGQRGEASAAPGMAEVDPLASYNITLDYSGQGSRGSSSRKDKDGKSSSSQKKGRRN